MNSDAPNLCLFSNGIPRLLKVHQVGALLVACDDEGVVEHLGQGLQHLDGWLVQEDGLGTSLGILEA